MAKEVEVETTQLDSYLKPKLGRNLYNFEKHKSGMKKKNSCEFFDAFKKAYKTFLIENTIDDRRDVAILF